MANEHSKFPVQHVIGFVLSLVFTFLAAAVALKTSLSTTVIMWIIGILAVIQAGMQLFMFMHMKEGEDGHMQTINIVYGFLVAIIIVFGSIWVLSSGHTHT
ncbi:cytochrome aa3 quinol oxidase subunit IV [Bacillaceae bacterium Marseille-Q3522]|nr:cytochrome aa3 quinol oxidase subunit IV [Bacillaceae bacterium Marseille-Q3522]